MAKNDMNKTPKVTPNGELDLSPERAFVVKRTGKQIASLQQKIRVTKWILLALLLLIIILYLLFYFFSLLGDEGDRGDFTVAIDGSSRNFITLSETADFDDPAIMLVGTSQHDMWHCTKEWIPEGIHSEAIGGAHSSTEPSYLAYTFHLKNTSDEEIRYTYDLDFVEEYVPSELRAIDALRIMVIRNGEELVWAKSPIDNTPLEAGTLEFIGEDEIIEQKGNAVAPGGVDKFTVVMWFEGNDPECVNDIFDSKLKFGMDFTVENPIKEKSE